MNILKNLATGLVALIGVAANAFATPTISVQSSGAIPFAILNLGTAIAPGFQSSAPISVSGFGDVTSITFSGGSASSIPSDPSGVYAGSTGGVSDNLFPLGLPGSSFFSLQNYLVAQANGGTVTITFASPQTSLDLLWGSADTLSGENVVTYGSGASDFIDGAQIVAAGGGSATGSMGTINYAVEVTGLPSFTTLVFSDSTPDSAFEFDIGNAVQSTSASTPEPSSLALMAACLGVFGWVARRRSWSVLVNSRASSRPAS